MEIPTSGFAHTLAQSCYVSHSVATSLHIIVSRKKKSVPELNDQPTYIRILVFWDVIQCSLTSKESAASVFRVGKVRRETAGSSETLALH